MNELITIHNVRGYLDENGTAHLNLEDVAKGLGFTQRHTKKGKVYESVRWERIVDYLRDFGFPPQVGENIFIPENVVYKLCFKASNEVAKTFQNLVADEILPSIRKHGIYATKAKMEEFFENPDSLFTALKALHKEQMDNEELVRENAELIIALEEQAPMVLFAEAVMDCPNTILIGDLAKILASNGIDIGQNRLFELLREGGFLMSRHKSSSSYNMPTQLSMNMELFKVRTMINIDEDGNETIRRTTKVTGRGQAYFINYFLDGDCECVLPSTKIFS